MGGQQGIWRSQHFVCYCKTLSGVAVVVSINCIVLIMAWMRMFINTTNYLTGTYTNQYSNHADDDCMPCTAGMYCAGWGRPLPNDECDEGWFCHAGSTAAQPNNSQCLAGHRCPRGSPDQVPCPSGQYQPYVEQGVCLECPAGKYCDQNEAIDEEQSGVGAPSHGVVTPKDCPAGEIDKEFCSNLLLISFIS